MIILPAADVMNSQAVRLYQGDYTRSEIVADSVLNTVRRFAEAGAEYIHMVDLDGAKAGCRKNAELIVSAATSQNVPVEVGGGIRTMEDIGWYIQNGISRVILGTAALRDEAMLKEAVETYGDQIAVGMDCRDGYVCTEGWLLGSGVYYLDFAKKLEAMGIGNIIFTDISKDGTLKGPNLEMLEKLKNTVSIRITASGGVHNLDDIRNLLKLDLYGAIVGKAIYTGDLILEEAIAVCREGK